MSFESDQQKAATEQVAWQADLQKRLGEVTLPQMNALFNLLQKQSGDGLTIPPDVKAYYDKARKEMSAGYAGATRASAEELMQQNRQGGGMVDSSTLSRLAAESARNLEVQQASQMRGLQVEEARSGMTYYNALQQLTRQGAMSALQLGGGAAGLAGQAIGGMRSTSQGGSIMGGAASGAALGSQISPGWGTLIGGVVGGIGGALSY